MKYFLYLIVAALMAISCLGGKVNITYHITDVDLFKKTIYFDFKFLPKNFFMINIGYWDYYRDNPSKLLRYVEDDKAGQRQLINLNGHAKMETEIFKDSIPFYSSPDLYCKILQSYLSFYGFTGNIHFGSKTIIEKSPQMEWTVQFYKACGNLYKWSLSEPNYNLFKKVIPNFDKNRKKVVLVNVSQDIETAFSQIKCDENVATYQIDIYNDNILKKNPLLLNNKIKTLDCAINIEFRNTIDDAYTRRIIDSFRIVGL